jgi:hypothetical protein
METTVKDWFFGLKRIPRTQIPITSEAVIDYKISFQFRFEIMVSSNTAFTVAYAYSKAVEQNVKTSQINLSYGFIHSIS